jgi:hypothetical protein
MKIIHNVVESHTRLDLREHLYWMSYSRDHLHFLGKSWSDFALVTEEKAGCNGGGLNFNVFRP